MTIVGAAVSWGSSPLTRGKRDELLQRLRVRRLIPAHAGKTCFGTLMITILRAHPRSRGENVNAIAGGTKETGSSPLTRGKQLDAASVPNKVGLIPAHAGKTRRTVRRGASAWAHPRSRGENQPVVQPGRLSRGSSPLTRGKPAGRAAGQAVAGLIPAHAGKTSSQRRSPTMRRAHPRSRGENGHGRREHLRPRGSSPLTRGKRWERSGAARRRRAHPRSRGENDPVVIADKISKGSSPLTRGKLVSFDGTTRFNGLIPAHAGKTRLCSSRPRTCRAHPRSRGENLYPRSSNSLVRGSSPLTRGKQDNHGLVACGVGLIPAHAGKTRLTP